MTGPVVAPRRARPGAAAGLPGGRGARRLTAAHGRAPVSPDELALFPAEPGTAVPDGPTLEDIVLGAWEGLSGNAAVDCLVCGDTASVQPRYAAAFSAPVGGRCHTCGSTLE